jgi:hypothetical protein
MFLDQRHRSVSDIWRDVLWGMTRVAPFAVVFGGMSLIGELMGVEFAGFNIERTIIFYVVFGLLTGVVVGMLRPIAPTIRGSGIIGGVVGLPLALYVRILARGWGNWIFAEIIFFVVFVAICAACAIGFRRGYVRAEQRSRANGPP